MRPDDSRPVPQKFPRVPFERRFYAFGIDFLAAWILSSFVTGIAQNLVFLVIWGGLRIVAVDRNQGQSLGSWCMDIKVLDLRFRRIPDLYTLLKREAVVGFLAMLALDGLTLVGVNPFSTLLLVSPLLVNCAIAYTDEKFNQALHDRLFDTVMIQTKRGYSLDIRVRDLLDDLQYRMRK